MRGYVDTSAGQVHYARAGEDGPDLVLLHCYNTTLRLYERALPLLGSRVRAWALDAPGAGLSDDPPAGDKTVFDVARWIAEAIGNLGIERPVLGGLHTGARMSLEVARVRGAATVPAVILSGSGPLVVRPGGGLNAPTLEFATDAGAGQWDRARDRYHALYPGERVPAEEDGWLQHIYLWCSMSKYDRRQLSWQGRVPGDWELLSFYESFPHPVLWLNTPEDCFAKSDEELAPRCRHASLRMLRGIGPHLMLRDPDAYAREIFAFLESAGIL